MFVELFKTKPRKDGTRTTIWPITFIRHIIGTFHFLKVSPLTGPEVISLCTNYIQDLAYCSVVTLQRLETYHSENCKFYKSSWCVFAAAV